MTRDVIVRLLVTDDEREALQAAADRVGLKLSEWIRQRCFQGELDVPAAQKPSRGKVRSHGGTHR
jgi:hypothetical protein